MLRVPVKSIGRTAAFSARPLPQRFAAASYATGSGIKLKLLTSKACSLCDDLREVLEDVQEEMPFELEEVDIRDQDHQLRRSYQYDIPVLLASDGQLIAKHRLTREKLLDYLRREASGASGAR